MRYPRCRKTPDNYISLPFTSRSNIASQSAWLWSVSWQKMIRQLFFFFFFFTCEEDCGLVIFWFPTYGRSAERNAQFHSVSVQSFGQFLFAFLGDGYREKDWKQNGDGTGARAKSVWFIVMISARLLAPRCIQMWLGDKVNLWKVHSILVPLPSAHWNASVNVSFFRLSRSSDRHLATHHHCFFFLFFFFHPWAPAVGNCFSAWKATHAPTTTRGLQAVQNVLAFIHLFTFTRLVRKEERKENAPECVLSVNPTCHLFPLCVSRSNVPISVIRQMCPN